VQTFLLKHFLADGLIVVDQSTGPHALHPSIFVPWKYVKDYVYITSVDDTATLCEK